jgi:flagellar biosynthesis protein FliR
VTLDLTLVAAFVLVLARTSAWVVAAPVFSARGMSAVGRLALALALAIFLAPLAAKGANVPADIGPFAGLILGQVLVGLVLGWATGLLLHAFEAAGTAVDMSSGLSMGSILDPVTGTPAAVFARLSNMVFLALLFVTNAHHALIEGFVRSFSAIPVDRFPVIGGGNTALAAGHAVTGVLLAALEIGAPVLGALFLTEVALALVSRFVPQANVFAVGLPLKVLVALLAVGGALVFFPARLTGLLDSSLRTGAGLLGG